MNTARRRGRERERERERHEVNSATQLIIAWHPAAAGFAPGPVAPQVQHVHSKKERERERERDRDMK